VAVFSLIVTVSPVAVPVKALKILSPHSTAVWVVENVNVTLPVAAQEFVRSEVPNADSEATLIAPSKTVNRIILIVLYPPPTFSIRSGYFNYTGKYKVSVLKESRYFLGDGNRRPSRTTTDYSFCYILLGGINGIHVALVLVLF
jgi:hypothetical protein